VGSGQNLFDTDFITSLEFNIKTANNTISHNTKRSAGANIVSQQYKTMPLFKHSEKHFSEGRNLIYRRLARIVFA
jgi:hypothetical protein